MAEKIMKTRIIHKHDTEENWNKATNFIPRQGEIIVYDVDATHTYERFKIGDGVTNVNSLPFAIMESIEITSSGSTNKNKWIKFATITLPSALDCCSGIFNFARTEGSYGAEGFLSYYFRNGYSTASTDVSLSWVALTNKDWASCVAAVLVSNGKFDLYYRAIETYESVLVTAINTYNPSYLTFGIGNYVDIIPAHKESIVQSYARSAGSAARLQTYKPGSTTETYGEMHPLMAQWENENTLKLYSENSITKVDYAETAGNVLTVVVTQNGDSSFSADKTYAEIIEAINQHKVVQLADMDKNVVPLTWLKNGNIGFTMTYGYENNGVAGVLRHYISSYEWVISSANEVYRRTYEVSNVTNEDIVSIVNDAINSAITTALNTEV